MVDSKGQCFDAIVRAAVHRQRGAVQLCCVLMDAQGVAALLQGVHEPVTLPQCVSAPQHQRFAPLLQQTGCSLSQQ